MASTVTPADVGRHYDELDGFYRQLWGLHVHHGLWRRGDESLEEATAALTEEVADLARIKMGSVVCDVGCGYGETSRRLWRERGARMTGVTVSAAQHVEALRLTPEDGPQFLLQDWLTNPFEDESFDAVIAIECLSHLPDRRKAFSEIARVLRPGGRVALVDWLRGDQVPTWQEEHLLTPIKEEGRLPDLNPVADYHRWIAAAGLTLEHTEDLSRLTSKTWVIVIRRLLKAIATDPQARAYLRDQGHKERSFALSPFRLLAAFKTGAFRFVAMSAVKPS